MVSLEKRFDVVVRDSGDVLILLSARSLPPHTACKIGFNGKDCALLSRDEHEDIALTHFPKSALKALSHVDKVFIWEITPQGDILFDYRAEIFKDPDLSLRDLI